MPNARAARAAPWTAVVLALTAALFFGRMLVRVDPDVFFHLREGGRVLTERRLPLIEDYSYTRTGAPMIATEWLSGAAFALLFRAGGYPLLAAFNALLLAAALRLMTRAWSEEAPPAPLGALLAALAGFALLNFALVKVQNFTFFFFALYLYWARLWERGRRWAPWAMAAALAVWVNLHGGFMLGWVLLAGVCGRDFLDSRRPRALAPWALGTLACFLHPNGATAFVYPIWFFFDAPAGRALIVEWRPLALAWSATPYALLLLALAAARVDRLRSRFPWAALALVFLVLGLRTRKMLPFFALSAGVAAGLSWARAELGAARSRLCLAGAAAVLLAIASVETAEARARAPLGPISDFEREYPRVAAEKAAALFPGRRMFHPYDWGGYLVYTIAPGVPVFIDGRLDPYWTLIPDYRTLIQAAPGWRELADAYGIETALLPPGSPLAKALSADPGWRAVGDDGRAVLFARKVLRSQENKIK
ncbi:MAG TPA: hypothetical protein VN915_12620 [Elusimicrobiota bacterium]|nr:hypothetical protein [Elusimicrobiota bacterium]